MTNFDLDVTGFKPALAVVAAHGMTDLHTLECLPHYAACLLLPLPSTVVTAAFCAASVVHFAEDGGELLGSLLVHAAVLSVGMATGVDHAFKLMLTYLTVWHLPNHYRRHIRMARWRGLLYAGVATGVALCMQTRCPDRVPLCDGMQRIVLAHVLFEKGLHA